MQESLENMLNYLQKRNFNHWRIEFNDHCSCYQTAKQVLDDDNKEKPECRWYYDYDPLNLSEKFQKMIATNTIWKIQIYPLTPIGFVNFHSYDLFSCVKEAYEYFLSKKEGEY